METAQVGEARQELAEVGEAVRPLVAPDAVRASLEAVRSAQAMARTRARTETRWARLVAGGALLVVGATAWAAVYRPPADGATAPATGSPSPAERPAATAVAAAAAPLPVAAAPVDDGRYVAWCDAAFEQRNWTAITATCPVAFAARPLASALAMRVAQAEDRRGHAARAVDWARKALAVDANLAEAYVIVARGEKGAERATAYRQYLKLAPQGWHASEARRALRAAR